MHVITCTPTLTHTHARPRTRTRARSLTRATPHSPAQVVVEPEVAEECAGSPDLDFVETFGGGDVRFGAARLQDFVDFVVCLGGDGVVLHASNLFPEAMPPVISFNLGSLGFLTNHRHEDRTRALSHSRARTHTHACTPSHTHTD